MRIDLDRFDIALLNLLQQDAIATAERLSESVPLSPSAITRRVRRLRAEGAVAADVALLSSAIVERRLRAVVHIQLNEHAEEAGLATLRRSFQEAREVQSCFAISGAFDLMAIVVVRDMADFTRFADALLAASPVVRRYETSFVKTDFKRSTMIWLDEADIVRD